MTNTSRPAALIVALSMADRIEYQSSNWLCVSKNHVAYNLVNEADSNTHLLITVADLHHALARRKAKIHWNYHSAGQVKLRERLGGDLPEGFTEHEIMLASFKEQIILSYEKLQQKRGKVSAKEAELLLPYWAAKANKRINTPARVKFMKGRLWTCNTPSLRTLRRDYKTYVECGGDGRALLPLSCKKRHAQELTAATHEVAQGL